MYTCDRCGLKVEDAYQITQWFNGFPHVETVCKPCIEEIGHVEDHNGTQNNNSDMPDSDSTGSDR